MIVKNEEINLAALLEQVAPVLEEIWIVDTGSTDDTLNIVREFQAKYQNIHLDHFDWADDFAAARNYAFSKATQEWVLWLDGDDRLENVDVFKRFKEEALPEASVDVWLFPYIYSRYPNGEPRLVLSRERLLRRRLGRRWVGAIHECIDICGTRQQQHDDIKVVHRNETKKRDLKRNVRILEKEYQKMPNDPRTAYYYGKELFDNIDDRGVKVLEHYLTLPGKYWDDETNCRARLSRAYLAQKRHGDAIRVANEIYHLDNARQRAEFFWIYGAVEQDLGNVKQAIPWFQRCLECNPSSELVVDREYYTWHPHKRLAECYHQLQDYEKALHHADMALSFVPGDPSLTKWKNDLKNVRLQPKAPHSLVVLELSPTSTRIRSDSHSVNTNLCNMEFATESIDGVVVSERIPDQAHKELARVIKPRGFLWLVRDPSVEVRPVDGFGELNGPEGILYQDKIVRNLVKADNTKPKLGFAVGSNGSAQYRYRITNTRYSAIKMGYPTTVGEEECDVYFGCYLSANSPGKLKVLEVCELLPNYDSYGIELADVVNCSSKLLADTLQGRFPNKKVINVDDHFEMPTWDWL